MRKERQTILRSISGLCVIALLAGCAPSPAVVAEGQEKIRGTATAMFNPKATAQKNEREQLNRVVFDFEVYKDEEHTGDDIVIGPGELRCDYLTGGEKGKTDCNYYYDVWWEGFHYKKDESIGWRRACDILGLFTPAALSTVAIGFPQDLPFEVYSTGNTESQDIFRGAICTQG